MNGPRTRDQRGFVLPTRLMVFSISAVTLAGLVFVATQGNDSPDKASPAAATSSHEPSAKPKPHDSQTSKGPDVLVPPTQTATPATPVLRRKVNVVVFNNSNIKGLAGRTATKVQHFGWNVIGSDNWYGTIDASTVYYGPKLKAAADQLAKDLGLARVKAAIAPMRADRLTVILTADYQTS
jgi:hypothetical protein